MSIETGEMDYMLKKAIRFHDGNQDVEGHLLVVREPTMQHAYWAYDLEQLLSKALVNVSQAFASSETDQYQEVKSPQDQMKDDADSAKDMADTYKMALMTNSEVKASDFVDAFKKMVCVSTGKPLCMIENKKAMTETHWDQLSVKDALDLAVTWCAFFVEPFGDSRSSA